MKLYGIKSGKASLDRAITGICDHKKFPIKSFSEVLNQKSKPSFAIPSDVVPLIGHKMKPRGKIYIRFLRSDHKRDFFDLDHGYFWRGHDVKGQTGLLGSPRHKQVWYRISLNGHMQTTLKDVTGERWDKIFKPSFGSKIKNRKPRNGKHVLVCPAGGIICNIYGHDHEKWLDNTLKILKNNSDREVRVRHKPKIVGNRMKEKVKLEDDLKDCYAVVTHSSTVAIHAQLLGIPTFCDPVCVAAPVSHTDFSKIESPLWDPDMRQKWLHTLAWSQFTLPEFQNGLAYKHMKRMIEERQ
jgi:hypothetical protein